MRLKVASIVGVLLVVALYMAVSTFEARVGQNADGHKYEEIEQLWNDLPIYPGMIEIGNSSNSVARKAHIEKKFKSDAPYDEVKQYYINKLRDHGWLFERERQLTNWGRDQGGRELKFRNGERDLTIEYAGTAGFGWDYGIGIYWYQG